jgi:hypothetical protein
MDFMTPPVSRFEFCVSDMISISYLPIQIQTLKTAIEVILFSYLAVHLINEIISPGYAHPTPYQHHPSDPRRVMIRWWG